MAKRRRKTARKGALILIMLGAVLIISALLLFVSNEKEDEEAGKASEAMLAELHSIINENMAKESKKNAQDPPKESETISESEPDETTAPLHETEAEETNTTLTQVSWYDYIGILTLEDLKLELPILGDWDYDRLRYAPCRHFGAAESGDLVIAGHNYRNHFARLTELENGDEVIFTDMNGKNYRYSLEKITTLEATDVEGVQNSGYELVLYTCTYSGKDRIAAFFSEIKENE